MVGSIPGLFSYRGVLSPPVGAQLKNPGFWSSQHSTADFREIRVTLNWLLSLKSIKCVLPGNSLTFTKKRNVCCVLSYLHEDLLETPIPVTFTAKIRRYILKGKVSVHIIETAESPYWFKANMTNSQCYSVMLGRASSRGREQLCSMALGNRCHRDLHALRPQRVALWRFMFTTRLL